MQLRQTVETLLEMATIGSNPNSDHPPMSPPSSAHIQVDPPNSAGCHADPPAESANERMLSEIIIEKRNQSKIEDQLSSNLKL